MSTEKPTAVLTQPADAPQPRADAAPRIAGYAIHEPLGHGGMATVYRATHEALEREVAIKVVAPRGDGAESYLRRLEHEALGLAKLSHPNIVELYDFGRTGDGAMYYVMPLFPGGDLSTWEKPADESRVAALLSAVLEALAHAHAEEIVHRDIKPENVLFDRAARPKLADFGAALLRRRSRLTEQGMAIGSIGYMSPEQARGVEIDARSDLYSVGVVAFELLTGRLPFEGPDAVAIAIAQAEAPVPRLPRPLAHWQAFFERALAYDPARRFESADAMRRALPSPSAAAPREPRAWRAIALGVLIATALFVAAKAWLRRDGAASPAAEIAQAASLIESRALAPPARPNARDVLASARRHGADPAALASLQEKLLGLLDADLQAALASDDSAALPGAWRRWREAVEALGAQRDLFVTAREGAIEHRVSEDLERALRVFDAGSAGAALAVVDAWRPAPEALASLAARVRAIPKTGDRFRDRDGPELVLLRKPDAEAPGLAIMAAPLASAYHRELLAAHGKTERACASASADVQGCIDELGAREIAEWVSERTGERYRVPSRDELAGALASIATASARAWTSTCRSITVAQRPNVARRAWSGVRRLFGQSSTAPTVTRCAGYFALALDGKDGDPKALASATPETTVVLVREIPAR